MVRSFRYVATLTAQRVVTSLVTATLLLGEARETAQRQLSAEKAKKGSKVRSGAPCSATSPSTSAPWSGTCLASLMSRHQIWMSGIAVVCCGWLVPTQLLWRACMCQ